MSEKDQQQSRLSTAYLTERTAIGLIGFFLPVVLLLGEIWGFGDPVQDSVSYYYYTGMRNVFVGGMCAIGVFLLAYNGHDRYDWWFTNIAGAFAICVAFCPTHESGTAYTWMNHVHPIAAVGLFIMLDLISFFLFTRTDPPETVFPHSGTESPHGAVLSWPSISKNNVCYVICSGIITACMIGAVVMAFSGIGENVPLLYGLETGAIMAFGVGWLVKGQAITRAMSRLEKIRPAPSAEPASATP